MSNNSNAEQKYIILIESDPSKKGKPYGIEKAFPIESLQYTDIGSKVSLSTDQSYRRPEYPLISTFLLMHNPKTKYADVIRELDDVLYKLRENQTPTTVTLQTLINVDNNSSGSSADKWTVFKSQELPKATLHLVEGSMGTYQIKADTATLGVGLNASDKKPINFKDGIAST